MMELTDFDQYILLPAIIELVVQLTEDKETISTAVQCFTATAT
jgi:hypothetical protein